MKGVSGKCSWFSLGRLLSVLLSGVVAAVLVGCQTLERRIERNAELFATFPPEARELIRAGEIDLGFTPEMVEIAWGAPDIRESSRSESGARESWVYLDRESIYGGRRFAGYEPHVYFDPRTKTRHTYLQPIYVEVYDTVEHERDRVDFEQGRVIAITRGGA